MKKNLLLLLIPFVLGSNQIDKDSLNHIGLKVWQNECRGTLDGLISWSASEEFPSLGLGHFIWYPEENTGPFEEGFPLLINFLKDKLKDSDIKIPSWLNPKKGFPWKTRKTFIKEKRSKKMQELRNFLSNTLDLQVLFLFERFKVAEEKILPLLNETQKTHLESLKSSTNGMYALVDYVNFKGLGLSEKERYRGKGWGLLQVIQNIPDDVSNEKILAAFITSAKQILNHRVKNAPLKRNEDQFLNGWFKRLETYLTTTS